MKKKASELQKGDKVRSPFGGLMTINSVTLAAVDLPARKCWVNVTLANGQQRTFEWNKATEISVIE